MRKFVHICKKASGSLIRDGIKLQNYRRRGFQTPGLRFNAFVFNIISSDCVLKCVQKIFKIIMIFDSSFILLATLAAFWHFYLLFRRDYYCNCSFSILPLNGTLKAKGRLVFEARSFIFNQLFITCLTVSHIFVTVPVRIKAPTL